MNIFKNVGLFCLVVASVFSGACKRLETPKNEQSEVVVSQDPAGKDGKDMNANRPPDRLVVNDWIAGGTCTISHDDGMVVMDSFGIDPHIILNNHRTMKGGPFLVSMRVRSEKSMGGTIYYNIPADEGNTTLFLYEDLDDGWKEASGSICEESIYGLRIDPAQSEGMIYVDWIKISDRDGKTIRMWDF